MERNRNKLEKMSKADIIDMIAEPPSHTIEVELTFVPSEPDIMYWYWNGGTSGCDDFDDFVKSVFPHMLREEREWALAAFEQDRDEDNIPF